ncbi:peroxidase-related enzyme [Lutimonas saemankumensis]|uniref:carboxymuconolactone decarboxylase family protein n=1 Tax=Lutimonas saemankumensis TaxID=483016 RepID=UPI001CD2D3B4|nr:peroxidase-related enzyme [Lutimonas saemankumensis]MCA0933817.1 peroxidase-related enzyme [Lutimonas saemankumensis]
MFWIKHFDYQEADARLKKVYDRVSGPDKNIDNILMAHSLRPHTLIGHMALYKNVLHNGNNKLPKWYLETIGIYVSHINNCSYCVEHHFEGLKRIWNDNAKSSKFKSALENEDLKSFFEEKWYLGLSYARKLTKTPAQLKESDVLRLKEQSFSDGEILEINQVVSYFNYANRTVLGLGVNTVGDILGLSPNDNTNPDNWSHV